MKWVCEVVQDFDGRYYANLTVDNKLIKGLPEYVDYKTLSEAIKAKTGICILKRKDMIFESCEHKKYALLDNTQVREDCRVRLSELIARTYQPKWS